MKLFNVDQIRKWDAYTIANEPIPSADLMERAANNCYQRIQEEFDFDSYAIVCGPGNNGGDGLVIARYLIESGKDVKVWIPKFTDKFSPDFNTNLEKIKEDYIQYFKEKEIPDWSENDCVIDALFGSGLARPLEGFLADLVRSLNNSDAFIISIDMPSGLYSNIEQIPIPEVFVRAEKTYTFQVKKTAFFNMDIRKMIGDVEVIPIGLHEEYEKITPTNLFELTIDDIYLREASNFTHKFEQGFALIVGGSKGFYGAPIMSAKAALKAGAGLVSLAIPHGGRDIAHASANELMIVDSIGNNLLEKIEIPEKVNAIGIGPGLGTSTKSLFAFAKVLKSELNLVIDADALNLLAEFDEMMDLLPEYSILTPHLGEFKRLFGDFKNESEKLDLLKESAKKHEIIIVLKGAITVIADPDGNLYFSEEVGNKGMATAGSGDVLTGIITSLRAQGYGPLEAALCGVYIHGFAGDLYIEEEDYRSLTASDIINNIGRALKNLAD